MVKQKKYWATIILHVAIDVTKNRMTNGKLIITKTY